MNINTVLLFGGIGPQELIIGAIVIVLLFGGRKIPELMKGLGQGMKEFKKARKEEPGNKSDDKDKVDEKTAE
ncbi:Sec-independent protein translocase subunit TatA/TatB [Carboxylicivirga sp. N1Y90]|uniref:Sec-independent protein translocase subunit TatA/TatB n=1 Tax=Carboxylicivirga fragile TaxID=3417571 RepID=UPI003D353704|nr:twin-arginine translocase TatA/TatE family subunit [Marinilabiliaceae bacterium N1Y90]